MKFQITVEVEPRTPEGWDSPADAKDTLNRLLDEVISGLDYEGNGVAFYVTKAEGSILDG